MQWLYGPEKFPGLSRNGPLTRLEHMDALESNLLFSIILNSLLRMLPHALCEPYSSHSACYVQYGVLLVRKNKCLFLKTPLSTDLERKQHTFGTFGQVNNKFETLVRA